MIKVRNILIVIMFTISVILCSFAIAENIDISSLSDEELLLLQEMIERKLSQQNNVSELESKDRQIEITTENVVVYVGKTAKLQTKITRLSEQAPKTTKLVWSSDNPEIASVSSEGTVKGISTGDTVIHVCASDDNAITTSLPVTVRASVASISVEEKDVVLLLGGSENSDKGKLIASVLPEDAFEKKLSYSSSNSKVVQVDDEGNLQAISAGKAVITITSEDKSLPVPKTIKCNITVNQSVNSIELKRKYIKIGVGEATKIDAEVLPESATRKQLSYSSSDEKVAMVSANGTITGKGSGTCIITIMTTDGSNIEGSCHVTVNKLVTGITVKDGQNNMYLMENESKSFSVSVLPKDATDKSISWSSSDRQVVTVSSSGNTVKIYGVGEGTATITGQAKDGSKKKISIKVTVEPIMSLKYVDVAGYVQYGYHYYVYKFKNTSRSRTIDGLTVKYWAEDVYHNMLRAHGFGDYYVEETLNLTIKPGETKKTGKIHTYGFDNAKYLHIDVEKVHYTDGTTVFNNTFDFAKYFTWD